MTLMNIIGCNDMLAVFVSGAVFAWDDWFTDQTRESQLQPVVDSVFNSTFFVMFGAALPWNQFSVFGTWKLGVGALLILFLRRLPAVFVFGPLRERRLRDGSVPLASVPFFTQFHRRENWLTTRIDLYP